MLRVAEAGKLIPDWRGSAKERKTAGRKIAVGQGPQKSNIRLSSREIYRRIKEFSSTKYAKKQVNHLNSGWSG
jgi:co-chaperonin GroES (HSP10)